MKIKPNAFAACKVKISKIGNVSISDAAKILQEVADRAKSPDDFTKAAGALGKAILKEAQEIKADAIRNAAIRLEGTKRITTGPLNKMAARARSILIGVLGHDLKNNVESMSYALNNEWASKFDFELKQAGLRDYALREDALGPISEAIWDARAQNIPLGTKFKDPAKAVAQIFMNTMEATRNRLNSEGARINEAKNFVAHTSHDLYQMRRGGKDTPWSYHKLGIEEAFGKWADNILPKLDAEKTFGDLPLKAGQTLQQAQRDFLRKAYSAMLTGIRKGGNTETSAMFDGTSNLARRLSEGRVFIFKDGKSWADYMKSYGRQDNFYQMGLDSLRSGSRSAALLHLLGTNPAGNYRAMLRNAAEQLRNGNEDAVNKFEADMQGHWPFTPNIDHILARLGAIPTAPSDELRHAIFDGILKFEDMTTLGSVGITHAVSLPTTYRAQAALHGIGTFRALGNLLNSMVPNGMRAADRAEILANIGAYGDGARFAGTNPYAYGVTLPGVVSHLHSLFIRATGIRYVMGHAKDGMRWALANNLAYNRGVEYGALKPALRTILTDYGIDKTRWDLLRKTTGTKLNDNEYMLPSHAHDIPDATVEALLGPGGDIAAYKQELADRLMMYYNDAADYSTVTPRIRERSILAPKPGSSFEGPLSLLTQFSAWPLAATHQIIGKTLYESLTKGRAVWVLGTALALSTISGHIRREARDRLAGRPPESPRNAWDLGFMLLRDAAAGGLLGVVGEHLIGSIGQQVQQGSTPIGGPFVGDLARLSEIGYQYAHSLATTGKYDPWPDLVHMATGKVPFANLFYTKGAIDYLAWYHLYEAASPGWWERTNKAIKAERGKGMAGYMPGAPIPYNPLTPIIGAFQ